MEDGLEIQRKKIFDELTNHIDRKVCDIYSTFLKPECEHGSTYDQYSLPEEEMKKSHNGYLRARYHLYQLFLKIGMASQQKLPDPISGKEYDEMYREACSAFAPAPLIGPDAIKKMIEELEITFSSIYPQTIKMLTEQLGFGEEKGLELPLDIPHVERIRYREELPKQIVKEQNDFENSISKILPQSMRLQHTVKIRIKKPHSEHHHHHHEH